MAIPDFMDKPIRVDLSKAAGVKEALKKSIPSLNEDSNLLISTPETAPAGIIGAELGGPCVLCNRKIWIAPSSRPAIKPGIVFACLDCIESVLRSALN